MEAWENIRERGPFQVVPGKYVGDSFSPLYIGIFHALWESYYPETQLRPNTLAPKEHHEEIVREKALNASPVGTYLRRDLF